MHFVTLSRVLDKTANAQQMLRYHSEGKERKNVLDNVDLLMEGSAPPRKTGAPLTAPGRSGSAS
jgi:hypothetical protein